MRVSVSTLLIALFIILPPAFAAAETKQTSDVTSLYHLANILGIQVSLAHIENTLIEQAGEHHTVDFASLIDAAKEIGLELQERNLSYEELRKFKTPIIAHLKTTFENETPAKADTTVGHFIVVEYGNKKWVRLFDTPGRFLYQAATVVSRDRFLDRWTGTCTHTFGTPTSAKATGFGGFSHVVGFRCLNHISARCCGSGLSRIPISYPTEKPG